MQSAGRGRVEKNMPCEIMQPSIRLDQCGGQGVDFWPGRSSACSGAAPVVGSVQRCAAETVAAFAREPAHGAVVVHADVDGVAVGHRDRKAAVPAVQDAVDLQQVPAFAGQVGIGGESKD